MAKEKTELVLNDSTDLSSVVNMLNVKIKEFDGLSDTSYKTGGVLEGIGDIKKETKIDKLIKAYGSVMAREKVYNESAEDLGLNIFPQFKLNGSTRAEWKHDINFRLAIIDNKDNLEKMKVWKEKLSGLMTKKDIQSGVYTEMTEFFSAGK